MPTLSHIKMYGIFMTYIPALQGSTATGSRMHPSVVSFVSTLLIFQYVSSVSVSFRLTLPPSLVLQCFYCDTVALAKAYCIQQELKFIITLALSLVLSSAMSPPNDFSFVLNDSVSVSSQPDTASAEMGVQVPLSGSARSRGCCLQYFD